MADIITQTSRLEIDMLFSDGDTRSFNLPNPLGAPNPVTADQINALSDWMVENQPLIGDEAGAPFMGISDARYVVTQTRRYDLTGNGFIVHEKQISLFDDSGGGGDDDE